MRWVRDRTGRFIQRPHYDPGEIDAACERLMLGFLEERRGRVSFPIDTDDIVALLESKVDVLDQFADLRFEGPEVEGATAFVRGGTPSVRIAGRLQSPNLVNRLRTTLTHELGHVHFHACLYGLAVTDDLFPVSETPTQPVCLRNSMLDAPKSDWMEWQAGYCCGALLMPVTDVQQLVREAVKAGSPSRPRVGSDPGKELIDAVIRRYAVSHDAGRVRLSVLGYLTA